MARDFGPFPSKPMYEVVNRRMQRALAEATSSTGFAKSGQGAVTAGTGAQLVIAAYPDGALVDGLWVENSTSETVTLTTNTASTNPRIDRLVMRLDMAAETIAPFQIVGTPGASPQVPPLVQTASVFDLPLCRYTFPGSASAQNPGSIVDERIRTSDPQLIASAPAAIMGGSMTNNGGFVQASSIDVPAHRAGRLHVQFHGSWAAAANAASSWGLHYPGGSPVAWHRTGNNSAANAPVAVVLDGYVSSDGTARTLIAGATVDAAGVSITPVAGSFAVWLL